MDDVRHLVIGMGEVGKAIHKIVGGQYVTREKHTWDGSLVDVVHICIHYNKEFESIVRSYQPFAPLIIVHSTTPVGICDALGVVHSPIRGVHPHLEKGIRTFVKYFGGKNSKKAAKIFQDLGIETQPYPQAKTTELLKLLDTYQYGKLILLEKEIYKICKKYKVSFRTAYQIANIDYNSGYTKLGMPHVVRPWLKHVEGPIGGHCVVPNAKLLGVRL